MMQAARSWSQIALLLALFVAGTMLAEANNLEKDACEGLQDELVVVLRTGAADDMQRGPAWAKEHASYVVLNNIKRLIEIEGQLRFRCNMANPRVAAINRARRLLRDAPPPLPERKTPKVAANSQEDPALAGISAATAGQDGVGTSGQVGAKRIRTYVSPQKASPYVVLPSGVTE